MNISLKATRRIICAVVIVGSINFRLLHHAPTAKIYAQSSCTNPPPRDTSKSISFPPGTKVYYSMDMSGAPAGTGAGSGDSPQTQVTNALNAWSTSNQAPGGNGITFAPADANNPATLIITTDTNNTGSSATTSAPSPGVLGPNNNATITFHPDTTFANTTTNIFQPNQAGYNTAYLQAALHEIIHVQGPTDYNPESNAPSTSVLKPFVGVNDTGNSPPTTSPSGCDVQAAVADSSATGGPGGSGGGDGGTGGNGGDSTGGDGYDPAIMCNWDEWWDNETNTLYGQWDC